MQLEQKYDNDIAVRPRMIVAVLLLGLLVGSFTLWYFYGHLPVRVFVLSYVSLIVLWVMYRFGSG